MSTDRIVYEQVIVELCRELGEDIRCINTRVTNGVVQLGGVVDTPTELGAVERAVWRVSGVRGIVQRIRVRRTQNDGPTDHALAIAVLDLLRRDGCGALRVRVEEGHVTVRGAMPSVITRDAVAGAVASVCGVRGVAIDDVCREPAAGSTPAGPAPSVRALWG